MGLEVTTVPSGLVTTNPVGSTDKLSAVDDHIQLVKTVVKNLGKWTAMEVQSADSSTSVTGVAGKLYICTGGTAVTFTLPASPTAGDTVGVIFTNGLSTNVIARNSSNICSTAENMTVNVNTSGLVLFMKYVDSTRGWVLA